MRGARLESVGERGGGGGESLLRVTHRPRRQRAPACTGVAAWVHRWLQPACTGVAVCVHSARGDAVPRGAEREAPQCLGRRPTQPRQRRRQHSLTCACAYACACAWHVHGMCTACAWHVHGMCTGRSHGLQRWLGSKRARTARVDRGGGGEHEGIEAECDQQLAARLHTQGCSPDTKGCSVTSNWQLACTRAKRSPPPPPLSSPVFCRRRLLERIDVGVGREPGRVNRVADLGWDSLST